MTRSYGIPDPLNDLTEVVGIRYVFEQKLVNSDIPVRPCIR